MKVCIREILETVVEVESIEEAELMYRRNEVELTAEDLKEVEYIVMEEE